MSEDGSTERQLFGERRPQTTAHVGSELGIVRVRLAPDRVGEFSLLKQCRVRAIDAGQQLVVAGTADDVLINAGNGFTGSGFGPAVAVGVDEQTVFAADSDGQIHRLAADRHCSGDPNATGESWEPIGTASDPVACDGRLLGAADGVYRLGEEAVSLGLSAVQAVSQIGPFAATADGLYRYDGDSWEREHNRETTAVTAGTQARAYALDQQELLQRDSGEWHPLEVPARPVALAYGNCLCGVTTDGRLLLATPGEQATDGYGGWRSQTLGVRGVTDIAVNRS